jgi:hypothetical protein
MSQRSCQEPIGGEGKVLADLSARGSGTDGAITNY